MSPKLLSLLLVVASFALYYILLGPLWSGAGSVWSPSVGGIKDLRVSEAGYDTAVNEAKSLFKQGEQLQREYAAVDPMVKEKMDIMVPSSVDPVRLLDEVTAIAEVSGIGLSSVTYSEVVGGDKLRGAYDVSFSVKTTYSKFKEFIENYEKSLRLFTLQSVSFSSPEKADDVTTFQVKLRTYYLK
jgi:hypothetical protein